MTKDVTRMTNEGGITRRRFIGVTAGAALMAGCSRKTSRRMPGDMVGASAQRGHRLRDGGFTAARETEKHDAVIVGGGIAGLAAARALALSGVDDSVVLELEDHAGGNSSHGGNAVS